jgi:hypothetical protein
MLKGRGEGALSVWGARQYARSIVRLYGKHHGLGERLMLRAILAATSIFKAAGWMTVGAAMRGIREGWSRARSYAAMIPPALSRAEPPGRGR